MMQLATSAPPATERRVRWKWFLALGAVLLVLGLAGVSIATLIEVSSLIVFGPLLLASSIMQLLTVFFAENGRERLLHLVAAGLELVFAFIIIAHPLEGVISLIVAIAIFLTVGGLLRIARVLVTPSRDRAWFVITGAIAVLLGISVWVGWPVNKLWFVSLCIAVDFICHGAIWSALSLAGRKPVQASAS
jgi:uncharacterized membrane protein HdeD (DUF308 family)